MRILISLDKAKADALSLEEEDEEAAFMISNLMAADIHNLMLIMIVKIPTRQITSD